ncbi:hypothetical protein SAMN02745146_2715 [Hymenobacter daecheongensis DSM 21074]|uniref:Lipocalin-like domain-containing protein n=1 Tax=Hymenobacter daecheongensis DSM 21074 TaxID=1121955 RepID=A0A1M6HZH2_9BACT|nr:hypothetical protein [Hymenobacter daecheongensis]SHJ27484.1 hypothetical protein SAMN02745146_2715 [Hymenobacter daecheongensis DSM 21074]
MKKMSVFLSLAAAATLSLSSCQKELEEVQPATQESAAATQNLSKSDLLTASPWHLTGLTTTAVAADAKETTTISLLDRLKPWVRDNVFSYKVGGTYIVDEAAVKVHPQAAQQLTGSWKLSEQGDSLIVTQSHGVHRFAVAELSATTLRLTHTEAGTNGAAASFTNVYSH